MKINTEYWAKPIPLRQFDWTATADDYEPGHPIGYGRTEQEAIADLRTDLDDDSSLGCAHAIGFGLAVEVGVVLVILITIVIAGGAIL